MLTVKSAIEFAHPLTWSVPVRLRGYVWARMAVSEEHSYLYVRIPKAANSTIMRTLAEHMFPDRAAEISLDTTGKRGKHMLDRLRPGRCLSTRCLERRYFTFSFFRDPRTRVLSAYLDKLQSDHSFRKYQWVQDALGDGGTARDVSFVRFVDFLEGGGLRRDVHWAPQTEICPVPPRRLDFCGRIEDIDAGLERVISRIFGAGSYRGINERAHNRQGAAELMERYFSPDLEERVRELYNRDFEELGYD